MAAQEEGSLGRGVWGEEYGGGSKALRLTHSALRLPPYALRLTPSTLCIPPYAFHQQPLSPIKGGKIIDNI